MLEVLRSGQLSLGPRAGRVRAAASRRSSARRCASAVSSGTAGAAPRAARGRRAATATRSSRARSRSSPRPTRSLYERARPVFADIDPRHAQPRPAGRRGRGHARARARCCRSTSSATRPTWRLRGARRAPRPRRSSRTPARRSARVTPTACAVGARGQPGGVRLLRQQAAHHRRGRHGHARRRRDEGAHRLRAQPGPRARHGLARPRPARLQLPPLATSPARSGSRSSSGSTGCSRRARASPRSTARRSPGSRGSSCRARTRAASGAAGSCTSCSCPRGVDRDETVRALARARHPEQALPAGDPPDELLPRALRPPRRASSRSARTSPRARSRCRSSRRSSEGQVARVAERAARRCSASALGVDWRPCRASTSPSTPTSSG